jgi:F0F1-type ATP synthase assembly protein I
LNIPEPPSDDEIEARLRRAAARSETGAGESEEDRLLRLEDELAKLDSKTSEARRRLLPENDPDFAARLAGLEQRAGAVKQTREVAKKQTELKYRQESNSTKGLATGLILVYMMIGTPMIGVAVGALVAHFNHSSIALPAGGFVGIVIGFAAALYLLQRAPKQ